MRSWDTSAHAVAWVLRSHVGDWDKWKLATSFWGGRDKPLIPRAQEEK